MHSWYLAVPIHRTLKQLRKHAHPQGWGMGFICEFIIWIKFWLPAFRIVFNIVLCIICSTAIYRESITWTQWSSKPRFHHSDVIMSAMASQITRLTIVCSTVYSGADQRKHQSSASLTFVPGVHQWPVNSPHKGPVTHENVSILWRHHVFIQVSTTEKTNGNWQMLTKLRVLRNEFICRGFFNTNRHPQHRRFWALFK